VVFEDKEDFTKVGGQDGEEVWGYGVCREVFEGGGNEVSSEGEVMSRG
jgi:hypothetical protein